ncbi:MAG TPA: PEPxxWA-CTERM sorting domain-containing protein [Sphingomonas sp.]|nr:PEPxxWA-CTERM sorting domain-containing protein [Sphingomonas sp.]
MLNKRAAMLAAVSLAAVAFPSAAWADGCGALKPEYCEFEHPENANTLEGPQLSGFTSSAPVFSPSKGVTLGFEGLSQYDVGSFGRGFVPPDTMGAVGTTQVMNFANGGVGVYSKTDGAQLQKISDVQFWANAGQTGANGDSRVLFDSNSKRWIALAFGNSVSDIQIAVSDTSDALGGWKSTKFTGFAGGTADYPTLAMDKNAIYIGTNNFGAFDPVLQTSFKGTTLNVIPLADILGAGGPTAANRVSFVDPYTGFLPLQDRGFAIQGVNSQNNSTTGKILAVQAYGPGLTLYDINNAGTPLATRGNVTLVSYPYDGNGPGRQPNLVPDVDLNPNDNFTSNDRVVDTLDDRVGSSVYQVGNKIYSIHTITPPGTDHTSVRLDVTDADTFTLLDSYTFAGGGNFDYYEGSLAVNANGDIVVGYNRSGTGTDSFGVDGKISVYAGLFNTASDGSLVFRGSILLKQSLVDDYHNNAQVTVNGQTFVCGLDGQVACGRQRWGDYSAVSLDPNDQNTFWVFGEFAREYNDTAGGHPGGSGGSRWGQWISAINFSAAVPEPATWAMMIAGFGMVGFAMRRSRKVSVSFA